jgi:hypothetical protein
MKLVIDGSTTPDPKTSVYDSDPEVGKYPPFIVFDIDSQQIVSPPFQTRGDAELWKDSEEGVQHYLEASR